MTPCPDCSRVPAHGGGRTRACFRRRDGLVDFSGRPVPGALLPVWAGALLLLGYALVGALAAHGVTVRRDVT